MSTSPFDNLPPIVIIPAYNESATIASLIKEVLTFNLHVLVIDDQSFDSTGELARKSGALVVVTKDSRGYGRAILTGLEYAMNKGYSHFVTIDGDGAHDPSEIPRVFSYHINNRCHLTIGDRFEDPFNEEIPSTKRWANHFAATLFNLAVETDLRDVACGFRALSKQLAESMLRRKEDSSSGFGLAYQMIAVASRSYNIFSIPVRVRYDGSELHCTRSQEIIDMLNSLCMCTTNRNGLIEKILKLLTVVKRHESATVIFSKSQLCLIPMPNQDSYVFQVQNQVFISRKIGTVVDFRLL